MAEEIVFYTHPMSRGRIIRWMLEEVGQPYRTEVVEYDRMKSPAYLAVNPMGKVPALTHRGALVTECAAICAYLADAFPAAQLAPPPGDPRRAAYYRWLFFGAGPVEAATSNKAMGWEPPPERQRMMGYGSYAQTMGALEQALDGREYLDGQGFTAADLYVGSQLGWLMNFGVVEKRPVFEAYVARLQKRPAYLRAMQIDDALVPAQPA
jgi:glutathione S-transferase